MIARHHLAAIFLAVSISLTGFATAQETIPPSEPATIAADQVDVSLDALPILLVPMTAEDLAGLADTWQGHLKGALEELSRLNISLQGSNEQSAQAIRKQLARQTELQSPIQEKYNLVLEAWGRKGGTEEELLPHRTYVSALKVAAVKTIDVRTLISLTRNWALSWEGGLGVLLKLGGLAIAIWVMMFVAKFVRRIAKRGLSKTTTLSRLLQAFIVNALYWLTFGLGTVLVLGVFGVNVVPLFAVFGGLSFILGFALQDTLGNLASGLMIMVLKPFDTGDYIQVAGTSGVVDQMSVVSTQIRTLDNQIIVVPNSKIWGDVITNVSASATRRVDLVFGIAYTDSAAHAIKVLEELVASHKLCLSDPAPEIFVGELGDSSVNIFCRPWSNSDDYWAVYWDLTGQAKERFDAEGISIPFPQRDVHLVQV
jgi:small conductance mechanosensitive channel